MTFVPKWNFFIDPDLSNRPNLSLRAIFVFGIIMTAWLV